MIQWGAVRRINLDTWLTARPTLPYTDDVARIWGEITAYAARRGRPRPHNGSWIAAACLAYDLPLATSNVKDFSDFAEHEGLVLVAG
ncbi:MULTISPECIES: type II toxin-antitoxin system VapC family toxin [unclassified Pseudonocardia]|uniref:type II toxin-antitoxin system VapC family toxin n=1 Tax=unclassified Pseudonocardia TaxID=2619320 RepID=UPI0001FFDB45|nr:type II toxin-antitoxin system VapC family toxin [Pseudonocardia sp. Ae707_Ps1]OLM08992.1 PIN (PilT N terminus) domain protein [Pseudonocardia sp. Ae707_Ps1]